MVGTPASGAIWLAKALADMAYQNKRDLGARTVCLQLEARVVR
jgi:hypothetical protein